MRRVVVLFIFAICSVTSFSQTQLFLRLTNPTITIRLGNTYLDFDIEVRAADPGYYARAIQANFWCNTGVFNGTPSVAGTPKGISAYLDANPGLAYNITPTGTSDGRINITVTAKQLDWISAGGTLADWYCEVSTSWQPLVTCRARIYTPASGISDLTFARSLMLTQELYQNPSGINGLPFTMLNPSSFDTTRNMRSLYVGRIYSSNAGWTQAKNPTTVDWSVTQNTSVWGSVVALSAGGALATNFRIHSGGRLKLLPGGQLTCSGPTEINEPRGLWIASDATGTGSFIDNGTITYNGAADVLVQRYLTPDQWHGYCVPLQDVKTRPYKDYYMKYYNNTLHRYMYVIDPSLDSTLNSDGIGYMMWSSSGSTNTTPVSAAGKLNTGAMTMSITRPVYPGAPGQDYDNWNFIGNPYPSAVDLSSANIDWNNTIQQAYFWSPGAGNYLTYIKAGGGTRPGNSPYAASQQGFFVRHDTTSTAATSFTYNDNSVRTHNTEAFLKEELADMLYVNVRNAQNEKLDIGVVRFSSETTLGMDENIDAEKLAGDFDAPQLWFPVPGDKNLIVDVLPWMGINMTVPLSYSFSLESNNLIEVSGIDNFKQGTQIFLEDKKLDLMQDLVLNPEYQFTSSPTDNPARFLLHFTKSAIGIDEKDKGFQIYSFEDYLYVKNLVKGNTYGTVWMYDLTGRTVFHADLKDFTINKFNPGVNGGYYAVKVITKDGVYTEKVYLQ